MRVVTGVAAAGMLLWSVSSLAQTDYPNRPVKLVVGFAPGGSTDNQHARDRGGRVFEAAVRSGEGLRAHIAGGDHAVPAGNAPADVAILAGDVQAVFGSMPALLQNTKANKVRPLAVGTSRRSPALPDVPTVAEQGYPGFEAALWLGIMAPAGTPKPIVDRLHCEIVAIVATPDFAAAMDTNGAEPLSSASPEQFTTLLRGEVDRYTKVVKAIGIKLD